MLRKCVYPNVLASLVAVILQRQHCGRRDVEELGDLDRLVLVLLYLLEEEQ